MDACAFATCAPLTRTDPGSLRARYGISDTRNVRDGRADAADGQCFHGSDSPASVRREFALVFEGADLEWLVDRSNIR